MNMSADTQADVKAWHSLDHEQVLELQDVALESGLSEAQVQGRRDRFGTNELVERGAKDPWRILWEQFTDTMVVVLIVAAVISLLIGDWKDMIAILAIVVLNAILGFTQEYRAEQAMAALKKMASPVVKTRRDGHLREIEARALVPGDIILLEAGDAVPADARIVEAANLRAMEASLTGESTSVDKHRAALNDPSAPLADRENMVYLGTAITYGRGVAVVVETGMRTELGRIAELIQTVESEQTPLQRRMAQLGRSLAVVALIIVAVVFALGLLRGEDVGEMFLTAVALAVAAVPEGLPAVVTISLALGAQRMLKRNALIRKLPAVETLGSVTVICSDKTGTLTENRMSVQILDVADNTIKFDAATRRGVPILQAADPVTAPARTAQVLLLAGGALCNDAVLEEDEQAAGDFMTIGDPTEGALLVAAARHGLWKADLETRFPRVAEAPFSSERKRMTTFHQLDWDGAGGEVEAHLRKVMESQGATHVSFTKGAVDSLLEITDRIWVEGKFEPLTDRWSRRIEAANDKMAREGLRVLGVAFRPLDFSPEDQETEVLEHSLTFVGMVGMMDPPRPEVKRAVETCRTAGIRPVMITGDHPLTARRIAEDLNISQNGELLTGKDLAKMSLGELEQVVEQVDVYARVSPEHKLNIVQALRSLGHIVAMTGDGVNDAPALRQSDIGVAMGITGTDVSKEAADMVILDDNFASIVSAVEEGRTIYDNVRKFVKYTMTSNAGEIYVMLFAPFLGLPLPLSALQILWINLVTDGLPGLALGVEPPEPDTMRRSPYAPDESIFARGMGRHILWVGLLMGVVSLAVGLWGWANSVSSWTTMVFTTLTLSQMGHALSIRSYKESIFRQGLFTNYALLGAVLLTLSLQMAVTYWSPLQTIFGTQALSMPELLISLVASTVVFWGVEVEKWFRRRRVMPAGSPPNGRAAHG
jgi:Ca2+-transporting ATPase